MKRTPGKTPAAREKYWTRIIEEARNYPAGITAFCRKKGFSKNNYYSYYKRLRLDHPEWVDLTNRPEISEQGNEKLVIEGSSSPPETEVSIKPRRRRYSADDKTRILEVTDNLGPGQLGAILRREGLYAHTLSKWRTERDLLELAPKARGPAPNPLAAENKMLKDENVRLEKQLFRAQEIIKLQKKVSELMGVTLQAME
jgi:transposase-like protein